MREGGREGEKGAVQKGEEARLKGKSRAWRAIEGKSLGQGDVSDSPPAGTSPRGCVAPLDKSTLLLKKREMARRGEGKGIGREG